MPGLGQEVRSIYNAAVGGTTVNTLVTPTGADVNTEAAGTTLTGGGKTTGAYAYGVTIAAGLTQIVANIGTAAAWLLGVMFDTPSEVDIFLAEVGSGAAKSETIRANAGIEVATDAGGFVTMFFTLPIPHAASTRVSARVADAGVGADGTLGIHVIYALGLI